MHILGQRIEAWEAAPGSMFHKAVGVEVLI